MPEKTITTTMIGNSQPRRDLIKEIVQCIPECYFGCFPPQTHSEILRMKEAMQKVKEPTWAKKQ